MAYAPEFSDNKFYTVGSRNVSVAGVNLNSYTKPITKLFAKGGPIDICNNFAWKNSGSTDEVPAI